MKNLKFDKIFVIAGVLLIIIITISLFGVRDNELDYENNKQKEIEINIHDDHIVMYVNNIEKPHIGEVIYYIETKLDVMVISEVSEEDLGDGSFRYVMKYSGDFKPLKKINDYR